MSKRVPLDREQLRRLNEESLIELILVLQQQMAAQQELIQQLQDQLAKDSHNSGKPPSSDGLKKGRQKSLRRAGQRPRGGQRGHKGRTLMQVAEPDHVILHRLKACPHCQTKLAAEAAEKQVKRQVFDIPPARIEVTEHQAEVKQCPGCGACVQGAFPAHVTQPTQYGPRLKAFACYLYGQQFIPLARIRELLTAFYGHAPSEAVVLAATRQLVTRTDTTLERIRQQLIAAPVAHFDESGLRVEGRLQWLHVASTAMLTHYHVHDRRGQSVCEPVTSCPALPGLPFMTTGPPTSSLAGQHAFCNVHHLRELLFDEQYRQTWADGLLVAHHQSRSRIDLRTATCPRTAGRLRGRVRCDHSGFAANPSSVKSRPRPIGRPKQSPPKNLLDRLHQLASWPLCTISASPLTTIWSNAMCV